MMPHLSVKEHASLFCAAFFEAFSISDVLLIFKSEQP